MVPILFRRSISSHSRLFFIPSVPHFPFYSFLSSISDTSPLPSRSTINNPFLFNYLIQTFSFSETKALLAAKRLSRVQTSEKPESAVRFLQHYRFSDTQIREVVQIAPQILFAGIEKTLKPKFQFFQELGLTGPQLAHFLSKNPTLLTHSLERRLAPCVEILRGILSSRDLLRVLHRCKWIIKEDPNSKLLPNISFLRNHCGIDMSQLSMLLLQQPSVFVMKESSLRDLVQKVTAMGFSLDSRLFIYALYTFSCMSLKTVRRKFELFRSYEFSEEELLLLFRKSPSLFRTSEEKLRLGLEFFVKKVGAGPNELVNHPASLMYSMEKRIVPRYRVLQILDSKGLLKKGMKLVAMLRMTEEEFLKRCILRFEDEIDELLGAYRLDARIAPYG